MHWVLLIAAIALEVLATSLLRVTEGFTRIFPTAVVLVSYGLAFYLLSVVVKSIPVGIAYAVWSGVGIILVALISFFAYGQKLDLPAIIGLGLIIAGVGVINLFSKSVGH